MYIYKVHVNIIPLNMPLLIRKLIAVNLYKSVIITYFFQTDVANAQEYAYTLAQ